MPAILQSNSGHSNLMIDLVTRTSYAHDSGFESSVSIRADHWDGDHTHPTTTAAEGLWLRRDDLAELHAHIAAWTNQPIKLLESERLDGTFELARLPGQRLSITFGARSDTIAHFNPVVSVLLEAGALRADFHFVTDQSCLAIFASELWAHLNEIRPNVA